MNIILASGSQRRRELMKLMGLDFEVIVSNADESGVSGEVSHMVKELAYKKASFVKVSRRNVCVVGSDTVVYIDGEIIGKPKDRDDAYNILRKLSGRTHTVYTGVAVLTDSVELVRCDTAEVTFAKLTDEEIYSYIDSGDPFDKAGSYGIQGPFCVHITRIEGSYFCVIGLPVHILYDMLKEANVIC